jgi:hypothetical protein
MSNHLKISSFEIFDGDGKPVGVISFSEGRVAFDCENMMFDNVQEFCAFLGTICDKVKNINHN